MHHPLRRIKAVCDQALAKMDEELTALYKRDGRPSIPPEQLLKASLLQMLYGIHSERQLSRSPSTCSTGGSST